jgi:hypothetical protein
MIAGKSPMMLQILEHLCESTNKMRSHACADLDGPQIYHLCFYLFAVGPKNIRNDHEWDLDLLSGADCWCNLHYFCEPGPFPGLPGRAVGTQGPKIGQKPRAGFIILSSPRSAQMFTRKQEQTKNKPIAPHR